MRQLILLCVNFASVCMYTVFPRNLAVVKFYFKALFGAATIRGQRLQRLTKYVSLTNSIKPVCT